MSRGLVFALLGFGAVLLLALPAFFPRLRKSHIVISLIVGAVVLLALGVLSLSLPVQQV